MAKSKIRILFYIRDKKINVYEYKNNKFESIQDCGEDEIEYSENFMNWFKGAIAYLKEIQELDYLLITDNSVELNFSDFDIVNESFWNKEKIREFNISILASKGLILRNVINREYYSFNVKRNPLEYTVIFCDKNINRNIQQKSNAKKGKGVKLPKNKQNKEVELQKQEKNKNINLEKIEAESKEEITKVTEEMVITEDVSLNNEINIAKYYKQQLKKEEEERMKIKSKF